MTRPQNLLLGACAGVMKELILVACPVLITCWPPYGRRPTGWRWSALLDLFVVTRLAYHLHHGPQAVLEFLP